jgi:hypothetical protein
MGNDNPIVAIGGAVLLCLGKVGNVIRGGLGNDVFE